MDTVKSFDLAKSTATHFRQKLFKRGHDVEKRGITTKLHYTITMRIYVVFNVDLDAISKSPKSISIKHKYQISYLTS